MTCIAPAATSSSPPWLCDESREVLPVGLADLMALLGGAARQGRQRADLAGRARRPSCVATSDTVIWRKVRVVVLRCMRWDLSCAVTVSSRTGAPPTAVPISASIVVISPSKTSPGWPPIAFASLTVSGRAQLEARVVDDLQRAARVGVLVEADRADVGQPDRRLDAHLHDLIRQRRVQRRAAERDLASGGEIVRRADRAHDGTSGIVSRRPGRSLSGSWMSLARAIARQRVASP